ncbi:hypothetical protein SKAU_G00129960 [Synaphobranchus kaupii]|uniref:RING-type E3 ubiquitin transferase n=1 Tax=Synaphobranchus kaupii TaxID=118154 RepID=A0A9Q1FQ71_SYNKA|nr:hypothetical protein SKAU_G00129960 [Synaphobranchus kaupii]
MRFHFPDQCSREQAEPGRKNLLTKTVEANVTPNNSSRSFIETGEQHHGCRTPRTLSCLHSFCEPCLELLLDKQKGTVTCPECRAVSDLQGCVRNAKASFFINSLLDLFRSKTTKQTVCSLCPAFGKSAVPASSRCLDCADFLCASCAQGHCLSKLTLGHGVVSLQEYVAGCYDEEARSKQERHCQSHQEPLRFYCNTCSSPICRDCRMLEHFSHQVLSLTQATTARRPQLEELIGSLDGNMRSLSQHEQEVDSAIQQLKEAESTITDQLSGHISVILEQLFAQRDAVCKDLSIFIEQQEQKYLSIKKDLCDHINSAQNTKDFSSQVMEKGKDYEILDLEETIQGQIERLQKVSIPDIERKTPLLMITEDKDMSSGIFQLIFDTHTDSQESSTVSDVSIKQESQTSAPVTAETRPQTAMTLQAQPPQAEQHTVCPSPTFIFLRSFDTDDDESSNHENITGISLCPSRDIVIADNSNFKIKRIMRNGQTRETINTDDRGWNDIQPFNVAVCDECIFFTSGSRLYKIPADEDDDIVQVCNLRGSHNEYCIAAYGDKYIAVSESTSCSLSLYDPRGILVDRVKPDDYEGKFVYLAVNSWEEFVVCDTLKKCIIILNRGGEILNICSSADSFSFHPRSICVDKWNNIYAIEGKRIMQFSRRGDFVQQLLSFSGYTPKLIAADDHGHLITVDKKGNIRIYRSQL